MAKNNYRAHGDMCDSSSISRRGALGLAAAAAFSPLCSHAEEVDEVPVVGDLDLAVNADAPAESWRFSDGIPVESSEPGDGTSFYAAFEKWGKNESGAWVNSIGDPIPGALTRGVDVSEWQKNIDWAAVKADDISFAIVRAAKWAGTDSKGRPGVDVYWERNAVACERQGIPYGAYIYSYATTASEAIEEAEYLISLMRGHRPSYPLYIDLEDSRIANANLYEVAAAFCRRIERAGYRAGVYANLSWWNSKLSDPRIGSWSRWVAQYNVSCDYAGMKDIWQATSKGSIAGISGFVDLNFSYASLHDPGAGNVSWIRLHGQNHLDTMQSISQAGWKACRTVVIATNASYHDALAASALAGACGSPVLISNPSSLPSQTAAEIKRLGARTAVLVGGANSISTMVEAQIRACGCPVVERVWGKDAPATARAVADKIRSIASLSKTCIVATAGSYHDALSVSPYAFWAKAPIYLCDSNSNALSTDTIQHIKTNGYSRAVVVGGEMSVSPQVERQLSGIGTVLRLSGANAYETSLSIAKWEISEGMSAAHLGVADGLQHYDALSGGALCGMGGSPLLVVSDTNRICISEFIGINKGAVDQGYVFGGRNSVSNETWNAILRAYMS